MTRTTRSTSTRTSCRPQTESGVLIPRVVPGGSTGPAVLRQSPCAESPGSMCIGATLRGRNGVNDVSADHRGDPQGPRSGSRHDPSAGTAKPSLGAADGGCQVTSLVRSSRAPDQAPHASRSTRQQRRPAMISPAAADRLLLSLPIGEVMLVIRCGRSGGGATTSVEERRPLIGPWVAQLPRVRCEPGAHLSNAFCTSL